MFTNFLLDDNLHDLSLDSTGNIRMSANAAEDLSSRIECRLRTFKGEWYLNRDLGVPYYSEVLKKNPDIEKVRALLLSELVKVQGIAEVLRFTVGFDHATRVFQVFFSVKASDGSIVDGGI
jgi:hypothetical protein